MHGSVGASDRPDVFCYSGALTLSTLFHLWDRLKLTFETSKPDSIAVHYGNSSKTLAEGSGSAHDDISIPLYLLPYQLQCVSVKHQGRYGSDPKVPYSLYAELEFWPVFPILLSAGLTLLFTAPTLSRLVELSYNGFLNYDRI